MSEISSASPELTPLEEPKTKPDISLVVSMYNSKPETLKIIQGLFLPSLLNNLSSRTQLVIVDDGSPLYGETGKMIKAFEGDLKSQAGDVVYKRFEENQGFAGAYNQGIKRADGEVLIIVNDDLYLPKSSVSSLVEVLKLEPKTGAVGPVVEGGWSFQGTNLFGRIKDFSPEELQRIEDFAVWLRKVMAGETYKVQGPRGHLLGSCLAFKREVFDQVGPLDERYRYGLFEDADWTRRVREQAEYDLVIDAATFVEHGGPTGASNSLKQNRRKQMEAIVLNAIKYGRKWDCLGVLPLDLAKFMAQGYGLMSINGEVIRKAKEKDLWPVPQASKLAELS